MEVGRTLGATLDSLNEADRVGFLQRIKAWVDDEIGQQVCSSYRHPADPFRPLSPTLCQAAMTTPRPFRSSTSRGDIGRKIPASTRAVKPATVRQPLQHLSPIYSRRTSNTLRVLRIHSINCSTTVSVTQSQS